MATLSEGLLGPTPYCRYTIGTNTYIAICMCVRMYTGFVVGDLAGLEEEAMA